MKRAIIALIAHAFILGIGLPAVAKEIRPGEKNNVTATIRTDGLACYFCAYGLERFFKKTGKIATFDMDMKEGLVTVKFLKDQPMVSPKDLCQYTYDAGFTPRWVAFSNADEKKECSK